MSETTYTVKHFLEKFGAISVDQWSAVKRYSATGRKSALGHCADRNERQGLRVILKEVGTGPATVNAGEDRRFKQKRAKYRVLAALLAVLQKRATAAAV